MSFQTFYELRSCYPESFCKFGYRIQARLAMTIFEAAYMFYANLGTL